MANDLERIPASVVVAKRNREMFEKIGVDEEKVFHTIRKAMHALRTPKEIKMGEHRAVKREADWPTRLKAVELWMELTCITPAATVKTMQGVQIEMLSSPEAGTAIDTRARDRVLLESHRAMAYGKELPPDVEEEILMPPKRLSLKDVMARREQEQSEREEVEATPRAQRFKPTTAIEMKDL